MKNNRLGNKKNGLFLYIILIGLNILIHTLILFNTKELKGITILHFILSLLAFTYLATFIADFLYSIRPSVVKILNGKNKVNTLYYMNTTRKLKRGSKALSVTISIPVYKEENSVIFKTIKDSIIAKNTYFNKYKCSTNIIISDDGIAHLLNSEVNKEVIENLYNKDNKTPEEYKVIERIDFYRKNNIGFVIRQKDNRKGLFKKASNLNCTLKLENCYYEGDININEIILLLDKDSGVNKNIIESVIPEFTYDDKLAYVQCATNTININDNYYSKIVGKQNNDLFHNIWPVQALRGFFVPFVGHNAFIRKSALKEINYFSEDKVSEDFDAALKMNELGYHGKYFKVEGLEFTEYCSRIFSEEATKQNRYIYGIFEMMFDGTIKLGKTRWYDILYMILYFISKLCIISTIPYTIFILLFYSSYNIGIICCGFFLIHISFIILPFIRKLILYKLIDKEYLYSFKESFLLSISFVGHSFVSLTGFLLYITNKFRKIKKGFKPTSVDEIEYSFNNGIKIIGNYLNNNKSFLIVVVLCLICIFNLLLRDNLFIFFKLIYIYILNFIILFPVFFNPHLFINKQVIIKTFRYSISSLIIILLLISNINISRNNLIDKKEFSYNYIKCPNNYQDNLLIKNKYAFDSNTIYKLDFKITNNKNNCIYITKKEL